MQRHFSDILSSNVTKTGDLERLCGYLMLENFIGHIRYVGRNVLRFLS